MERGTSPEQALEEARRARAVAEAARWQARKERIQAEELEDQLRDARRKLARASRVQANNGDSLGEPAPEPEEPAQAQSQGNSLELQRRNEELERLLEEQLTSTGGGGGGSAELRRLAFHDLQTGLPNETFVLQHLTDQMTQGHMCALLLIDVDRFRIIENSLGRSQAQDLVRQLSGRLGENLEDGQVLAVRGDHEFFLVACAPPEEGEAAAKLAVQQLARSLAQKVSKAIKEPVRLEGHPVTSSASIGISVSPGDAATPEEMVDNAEQVARSVRQRGGNRAEFFSGQVKARALQGRSLVPQVREAYQENQFGVLFEPVVELKSGKFQGAWIHLRWNHPTLGVLSPHRYRDIVEQAGMVTYVFDLMVLQASWHYKQQKLPGNVFLPVPASMLLHEDFATRFMHSMSNAQLPAEQAVLFLLGSLDGVRPSVLEANLDAIARFGIGLGSDVFPDPLASRLLLKSDRRYALMPQEMVTKLPDGEPEASLCAGLARAARNLDTEYIGAGAEVREQLEYLVLSGISLAKGPIYGEAAAPEDLRAASGSGWTF